MSEAKIDKFPCIFPAQQGIGGFRNAEARQATAPAETAAPGSEKPNRGSRCRNNRRWGRSDGLRLQTLALFMVNPCGPSRALLLRRASFASRSEERRVGKECKT